MRTFDSSHIPAPIEAAKFSCPSGPLDVEIGSGVGQFAIQYAKSNPGRSVVGIEKTRDRFRKFEDRLSLEGGLSNLQPVHANAISWVHHQLPKESVDRFFILYPNPYPKKKQSNLRWALMPFMGRLLESLKTGGTIEFATNIQSYADETETAMTQDWGVSLLSRTVLNEKSDPPRTPFEEKYLERGETCHGMVFCKK